MVCLYFLLFCPIYVHVSYLNILSIALKLDDIIVAKNKAKQQYEVKVNFTLNYHIKALFLVHFISTYMLGFFQQNWLEV